MEFGQIKSGFYSKEGYQNRYNEFPIYEGKKACMTLGRIGTLSSEETFRGLFQYEESGRWVAFECHNGEMIVEDFDDELLAWAWVLMYDYGYYHLSINQWIAFKTIECTPTSKSFSSEEEAICYINQFKEQWQK